MDEKEFRAFYPDYCRSVYALSGVKEYAPAPTIKAHGFAFTQATQLQEGEAIVGAQGSVLRFSTSDKFLAWLKNHDLKPTGPIRADNENMPTKWFAFFSASNSTGLSQPHDTRYVHTEGGQVVLTITKFVSQQDATNNPDNLPLMDLPGHGKKSCELEFKGIDSERRIVSGWASTPDVDLTNEIVVPSAFAKALAADPHPPVLWMHDMRNVVGKILNYRIDNQQGLWVEVLISKAAEKEWTMIQEGVVRKFSFGFKPTKWYVDSEGRKVITELQLYEISLVGVPANPRASVESVVGKDGDLTRELCVLMDSLSKTINAQQKRQEQLGEILDSLQAV